MSAAGDDIGADLVDKDSGSAIDDAAADNVASPLSSSEYPSHEAIASVLGSEAADSLC